jgi:hypothetical protein
MKPVHPVAAIALLLALAACGNSPQQPSGVVDDKAAEAPGAGLDNSADVSPDFEDLDTAENLDAGSSPGLDPVETASVPAPPADLTAIAGRWGLDEAACAGAGTVSISPSTFESPERICDIASAVDGGDGSVTVTLSCPETGGEKDGDLLKLNPEGGGLSIGFIGGSEPPETYVRCR